MADDRKNTISTVFLATYHELARHVLRRFGRKTDAEDVLQNTYLRIQKIPPETEISNPRSYLFTIANNVAIDQMRSQKARDQYLTVEDYAEKVDESPAPDRVLDYRQRLARLRQAVSELPERQRQAFLMHKFDGMSHAEIASALGITKSAVEKLIMKALAHLRDRIGEFLD